MRMRGSEGSNAVACASVQMDPLLSLTISTYNCVQAGMQSCMSNKRKGGQNNFEQLFSLGKNAQKPKLEHQNTSSRSQPDPGEYMACPQTLSLSFKSSLVFDYSAGSSKAQVSAPSIAALIPPSSLQQWGITRVISWSTDSQSLGQSLLYPTRLASFGFVWRCSS